MINNINKQLKGQSFSIVALFIVSALGSLFFNIPELLLDTLIGINICLSLVILFTAMKIEKPTDFSVLPTLLLISTVFRLTLNISSTKSILTNGSAGKLIQAFGTFVAQKNIVVGILAFLIILLVQFLVIGKGAERISEISARFTLDGMSLKYMAVEGELNQGIIDAEEAKRRRENIQKNSDFYGAMDGATKFIKGDTITGLIIVVINIVAGISVGMMTENLSMADSMNKYTLLTIGDGLLSVIPSLITSFSTGLIVTRPYSNSDVGEEIFTQIGRNHTTFYITSGIIVLFVFIPGVNKLLFLGLSSAFATIGYFVQHTQEEPDIVENENNVVRDVEKINYVEEYNSIGIEIQLGYGLINLASDKDGGQLLSKLEKVREKTLRRLGFLIPSIKTRDNVNLMPYEYQILINGLTVGKYEIQLGKLLAISPTQEEIDIEGIDTIEPGFGLKAKWISSELSKVSENKGYQTVDTIDIITTHLENVVLKHAHEILNREQTKELVGYVEEKNPTIVKELIPNLLSLGQVQGVLANLLEEGVSIKNLNLILEVLCDKAHLDKDIAVLTDFARVRLRKEIIDSLDQDNEVYYITFDYKSEELLRDCITQNSLYSRYLALKPEVSESLMAQIEKFGEIAISYQKMPVIACSTRTRFYLSKFLNPKIPFIKILSDEELSISDLKTVHIGTIKLCD